MAQGAQVTGNLIHDNEDCDIFTEVNHGPHVIANNILLSPVSYHSCSPGGAYAHNLIIGGHNAAPDGRETPYHKAHSTEVAGRRDCPLGDVRWYNNLLAGKCNLTAYDKAVLPVAAAGNVFTKGAQSSKFDEAALLKPDFDPGITLTQQADGWYLELNVDKAWATEQKRRVVATEMLGKAVIPDLPFENADGSPLKIDTDYFGKKRDTTNPFPGPFEVKESGKQKIKVWPLASTSGRAGAPNFWDEIPLSPSTRMPSVVLDDYWKSEFQRVNREVAAAQNTRLVFFGDSITEGADSNSAYRRYLDGMLRRDGHLIDFVGSRRKHSDDKAEPDNYEYDVDHEGHWGKGSAWMAENMQRLLASNVPDVAVIHLGTEDILSSNAAAESLTDGILQNIGKVVDALRAKNGNVKIVFSTIIPVKGKESVVSLLNLKISRYVQSNSTLPCPVVIANHHEGFDVSRDLAADGAHPNASGARKMARVCADVIHNTDLEGQPK
jgi:lysophospholipase L1-like esterase